MTQNTRNNPGMEKLTQKYRTIFRVPENLNHYSEKDYQIAERKFLKYALEDGLFIPYSRFPANPQRSPERAGR